MSYGVLSGPHGHGGHHGGGGGHHGGRPPIYGPGGAYFAQPGGWGPQLYSDSGPLLIVSNDECRERDAAGRCAFYDRDGKLIGFRGLGEVPPVTGSLLLVAGVGIAVLAAAFYALRGWNPMPARAR